MARYVARAGIGTIEAETLARLSIGIGDLLLWAFDCGVQYGSGQVLARPPNPATADLLDILIERHRVENARMDTFAELLDAPLPFDDAPAWLRAHAERLSLEVKP